MDADPISGVGAPVAMTLPFTASSAGVARHELQTWLDLLGLPATMVEDSQLIVSELVGNAVRHARPLADGTMLVCWGRDDQLLDIAVTDGGSRTVPTRMEASLSDPSGRGLAIVEAISSQWWFETTRSRSTVHALVPMG